MQSRLLVPHQSVLQIAPNTGNPEFARALLIVDEVKSWGVQGYVRTLTGTGFNGEAYYRAKWNELEYVGELPFKYGES